MFISSLFVSMCNKKYVRRCQEEKKFTERSVVQCYVYGRKKIYNDVGFRKPMVFIGFFATERLRTFSVLVRDTMLERLEPVRNKFDT